MGDPKHDIRCLINRNRRDIHGSAARPMKANHFVGSRANMHKLSHIHSLTEYCYGSHYHLIWIWHDQPLSGRSGPK
jgi:hypothetical protein